VDWYFRYVLLYILDFKREPLIKIRITQDVAFRVASLGEGRFNLASNMGLRVFERVSLGHHFCQNCFGNGNEDFGSLSAE